MPGCIRKYLLISLLPWVLIFSLCATAINAEPVKLKVLVAPFLGYAPFFIAMEEGYFEEQGLEIEFVKMGGTREAIPALAQGKLDVLSGDISIGILNAIDRGEAIRVVAGKGYIDPGGCAYNALLVRKDLAESGELSIPAQLQGRRIAVTSRNSSEYYFEKLLKTAGLTLDDVTTKNVPIPVRLKALETGAVDVVNTGEPWITRILRAGTGVVWVSANDVIPGFQYAVIFYGPTLLNENPDAGRRFMIAYLKAVQQYNQGKTDRNVQIMAKHTGVDQELLREACWSAIRSNGRINVSSVVDFQAWCVEKGWLDGILPEDRFLDQSFVDYATGVLGIPSE